MLKYVKLYNAASFKNCALLNALTEDAHGAHDCLILYIQTGFCWLGELR